MQSWSTASRLKTWTEWVYKVILFHIFLLMPPRWACRFNVCRSVFVVQLMELHQQAADILLQDAAGCTLLHHAVQVGSKEILKYLIDNGGWRVCLWRVWLRLQPRGSETFKLSLVRWCFTQIGCVVIEDLQLKDKTVSLYYFFICVANCFT